MCDVLVDTPKTFSSFLAHTADSELSQGPLVRVPAFEKVRSRQNTALPPMP